MAAPTVSTPGTPSGQKLDEGFSIRIAFENDLTIALWIKAGTPPGWDAGDMINVSDMHNVEFITKAFQALIEHTGGKFTAHYAPKVLNNIRSQVGRNQGVTWKFPNGTKFTHWGGIKSFKPNELKKGEDPTAEVEVEVTNRDNDGAEFGPVVTLAAGSE